MELEATKIKVPKNCYKGMKGQCHIVEMNDKEFYLPDIPCKIEPSTDGYIITIPKWFADYLGIENVFEHILEEDKND